MERSRWLEGSGCVSGSIYQGRQRPGHVGTQDPDDDCRFDPPSNRELLRGLSTVGQHDPAARQRTDLRYKIVEEKALGRKAFSVATTVL